MQEFKNDAEIINYIKEGIESICNLDENRLYKEEQLQITDDVMLIRNCIEWVIRINKLINHLKYALVNSFEFAKKINSPLEDTKEKDMYSYYLEDAVYRDIILWDMFRQLLNEYYECGYPETEQINIFDFLKNQENKFKIGKNRANKILKYLRSPAHQYVRTKLRNSFTHSVESTSTYIFHKKDNNGFVKPQLEHFFPKHPYENICYVIDDIKKWSKIIKEIVDEIHNKVIEKIMIVNVTFFLNCGLKVNNQANVFSLKEEYERIIFKCNEECEYIFKYNDIYVCKPKLIKYCRINETSKEYRGELKPILSFEEMEKIFD